MNIGLEAFRKSAVLLRINEGAMLQAASAIEMWRKADFEGERIVVDSLVRRRAAEKALFLTPTDGFVPTPSPVVRPQFDYMAMADAPAGEAVNLNAPLDGEVALAERAAEAAPVAETPAPETLPASPEEPVASQTEIAAASVNARLQAILDSLDLSEAVPERPEAIAPEPPLFEPAFEADGPTPPPVVLPLPDPSAHVRQTEEITQIAPFPQPAAEAAPQTAAPVEPFNTAGFDAGRVERSPASYLPLAFMLAVGVALLASAIYWFVHAHPRMGAVAPSLIGWALGLAGVGLLATSAYFLLERISQDDD
jgi:lysozyme